MNKYLKRLGLVCFIAFVCFLAVFVPSAYCTTSSMGDTLTEWMPTMLEFAIIGMVFGMLKKFTG